MSLGKLVNWFARHKVLTALLALAAAPLVLLWYSILAISAATFGQELRNPTSPSVSAVSAPSSPPISSASASSDTSASARAEAEKAARAAEEAQRKAAEDAKAKAEARAKAEASPAVTVVS